MQIEINGKKKQVKANQTIDININNSPFFDNDDSAITRDEKKCIDCGLCREACLAYNNLDIPQPINIGASRYFRPDGKKNVIDSKCTRCGQCLLVCPTGTLSEKNNINDVKKAIQDKKKIVIAQVAPSIRVSLGDDFDLKSGEILEGQTVSALKKLGFDYIFDVNLGADFTTYEEALDLKLRLENNERLPLFTSCCPARVKYIEDFHPDFIPNITTVRSPQQCLATIIKTYFAKKKKINPKDIVVVSIMPCVAKKFESRRKGEDKSGHWDVDWVLTTREFISMLKEAKINLGKLSSSDFDDPLGISSGAGAIYGASGGVMESAVRTYVDLYSSEKSLKIDYKEFRGMQGIKKAEIKIGKKKLKIAIATGLANAEKIIAEIRRGAVYHYVEVMACPGGCVGGGGQPKFSSSEVIDKRRKALYDIDKKKKYRLANKNPILLKVYKEFLISQGSKLAHKLLHTTYQN